MWAGVRWSNRSTHPRCDMINNPLNRIGHTWAHVIKRGNPEGCRLLRFPFAVMEMHSNWLSLLGCSRSENKPDHHRGGAEKGCLEFT